jgi:hypothetical protein
MQKQKYKCEIAERHMYYCALTALSNKLSTFPVYRPTSLRYPVSNRVNTMLEGSYK